MLTKRMGQPDLDKPRANARQPEHLFFSRRVTPKSPNEALQPEEAPPPPAPPPRKRRPVVSVASGFLSFLMIAAVGIVLTLSFAQQRVRAPGPLATDKVVAIAPGTDVPDIIDQLEREGVIDTPLLMNLSLLAEGSRSKLKAGEYQFKQSASLQDVIDTLVNGKQVLHSVTIAEGLTSEQVLQKLRDTDFLAGDIRDLLKEGSILPETYKVSRGTLRPDLIKKMQDDQKKAIDQIWGRRSPDLPIKSPFEMVTLASIVEKETGRADERTRVAGVFMNRLLKHMRLQSDPTIVYGLVGGKGTLGRGILRSELEQVTPYNTYLIDGLPPGPIANPGRAALEAVANPSRTKELYFVADGTGGHAFAETLDQHVRNVQRWRQIEKDAKDKVVPEADKLLLPPAVPGNAQKPDQRGNAQKPDQRGDAQMGAFAKFGALRPSAPAPGSAPQSAVPLGRLGGLGTLGPPVEGVAAPSAAILGGLSGRPGQARAGKAPEDAIARMAPPLAFAAPVQQAAAAAAGVQAQIYALTPSLYELGIPMQDLTSDRSADISDDDQTNANMATYPMSPSRRAEQRARAAQLGLDSAPEKPMPDTATASVARSGSDLPADAPQVPVRTAAGRRVIDVSEGTLLDPLLNKTFDLNSPKVVPSFK